MTEPMMRTPGRTVVPIVVEQDVAEETAMNDPTMPSRIVPGMPIESLPGTSRRASAPAMSPTMISEMMRPRWWYLLLPELPP